MNNNYINIYNNLINLTRNKKLYENFSTQDTFSDRIIFFMFHFAFFLKVFKKNNKKKILQEIYDQIFKYLELSVREMGYGDATINKKMKNYLNTFHSILDQINDWEIAPDSHKTKVLSDFLNIDRKTSNLIDYFDNYIINLSNNTLNFYIKGVVKDKF
jgi:cytochrome b pre-mRNA-processing protein 3